LDITPLETPEPELSYIFKHIITQEVAYNLMSFAQRQGLHQAIAEWLEDTYADDLAPYYPLLAYHWQKALGDQYGRSDLGAKTLEYLEKAAEQALNSFANREAADFYDELLRVDDLLANPSGTFYRARWQRGLGEALFRLGDWEMGSEHIEIALALLNHPLPSNNGILAVRLLAQIVKQAFYRLRSAGLPSRTQLNQQQHAVILEAAHAYNTLSLAYWFREELSRFIFVGVYNVNLTQHLGPSPELFQAYANLAVTLGSFPGQPFARAYLRWTIEMSNDIDDLSAKAFAFGYLSMYLSQTGDWLRTYPKNKLA
jgi:tetratricopeptide (TPR) repeat protein